MHVVRGQRGARERDEQRAHLPRRERIARLDGRLARHRRRQPLAGKAGADMLDRGGNAIDAAIAANAVLGLVEPHMNGVGGDLFVIVYEAKTGKLHGLNASGWAPTGLTHALLAERGLTRMPNNGIFSVTVPGAVAGWDALRSTFGSKPFSE